jgi:hypothetical protein
MANFARDVSFRSMPNGEWITFGSLPDTTTRETFGAWLREIGFDVTDDRISVRSHGKRCSAVVSFPHSEFAVLANWVINQQTFLGLHVVAQPYAKVDRNKVVTWEQPTNRL